MDPPTALQTPTPELYSTSMKLNPPTSAILFLVCVSFVSGCNKEKAERDCKKACHAWGMTPEQREEAFDSRSIPDSLRWAANYERDGLAAVKECSERAAKLNQSANAKACFEKFQWACIQSCKADNQ